MAPILSDIFLSPIDHVLRKNMVQITKKIFRYVDDYLALMEDKGFTRCSIDISTKAIDEERKKMVVLPYVHRMSHGFKNVAARYGVKAVFSSPLKIPRVRAAVERKAAAVEASACKGCGIKHNSPLVRCCEGVVYPIPNCGA